MIHLERRDTRRSNSHFGPWRQYRVLNCIPPLCSRRAWEQHFLRLFHSLDDASRATDQQRPLASGELLVQDQEWQTTKMVTEALQPDQGGRAAVDQDMGVRPTQ
jgi:hypothetical protein